MPKKKKTEKDYILEIEDLRLRLDEAMETLSAIRRGEVDGLVVSAPEGERLFTLSGAERSYRLFVESMNEGAVTLALDGTILYCNNRFAEMVETPQEQVVGSSIYRFMESPDLFQTVFQKSKAEKNKTELLLKGMITPEIPVSLAFNPLQDEELPGVCLIVTDLTEHVREEERILGESEERYRHLFENLNSAFLLAQPILNEEGKPVDLKYLMANPAVRTHLSKTPEEMVGRRYSEVFNYPAFNPVFDTYEQVLSTGEPYKGEILLPATGHHFDISVYRPEPGLLALVLSDISDKKKAEEDLRIIEMEQRRQKEFLETLVDYAGACIAVVKGRELRYTLANPAFEVLAGGLPMVGRTYREVFPEAAQAGAEAIVQRVLETGETWNVEGYQAPVPGNPEAIWQGHVVRLPLVEGEEPSALTVVWEISALKKAEKAIKRQSNILAAINSIFQEAISTGTEGQLGESCLKIVEELTGSEFGFIGEINENGLEDIAISDPGWDKCRILDPSGHRIPPGNFKIHGLYGKVIRDGIGFFSNEPSSHPDSIGIPKDHPPLKSFLGVPLISDLKVRGVIAVANRQGGYTDHELEALEVLAPAIVEAFGRKRAEDLLKKTHGELEIRVEARTSELNETIERLEKMNQELEEFAYIASHDLQEPLRKIQTFGDMAQKRYAPFADKTAQDYLDRVLQSAERMRQLLKELLALSRVTSKRVPYKRIELNLTVKEAADIFEAVFKETGGQIITEDLPAIEGDESQIRQLFQNLIGNAIKFRDHHIPLVRVKGRVIDQNFCEIAVKDNGIGFEQQYAELIFKPFERL
ncbi:MAG TPA: PAS domain-containing protein, partial [Thermodesulfobacteriota bacterium]|nr:PAS domain-containing protein [Thermodesulfobacteriota bacterium]